MIITYDYHVLNKIMGIMKSGMHICVFLRLLQYFTCFYGFSHVNKPFNFFPCQNYLLHYSDICNFYSHDKLSVGFSSALKRNWKGIDKKELELEFRAANQYGISVFCTDFTCKIREYEFGLENTEIELCQFCHLKYCCQNKAYLFWVANQSGFVAFYALEPSNTSLITKTFNLLSSTCSSSMLSCLTSCSCSTGSIH